MIHNIRAKNFMAYATLDLEFPPTPDKYLIRAVNHDTLGGDSNMSGKTTLVEAINFAIFGKVSSKKKKKEDLLKYGAADGWVEVTFSISNLESPITVYREITTSNMHFKIGETKIIKSTPTLTQTALFDILGFSKEQKAEAFDDFLKTVRVNSTYIDEFAIGSPTKNTQLLSRIFGQEIWDYFVDELREELNTKINPILKFYNTQLSNFSEDSKRLSDEIVRQELIIEEFEKESNELEEQQKVLNDRRAELKTLEYMLGDLRTKRDEIIKMKTVGNLRLSGYATKIENLAKEIVKINEFLATTPIRTDSETLTQERARLAGDVIGLNAKKDDLDRARIDTTVVRNGIANELSSNSYYPIPIDSMVSRDPTSANALLIGDEKTIRTYRSGDALNCPSCSSELLLVLENNRTTLKPYDDSLIIETIKKQLKKYAELRLQTNTMGAEILPIREKIADIEKRREAILKELNQITTINNQRETVTRIKTEHTTTLSERKQYFIDMKNELGVKEDQILILEQSLQDFNISVLEELDESLRNINKQKMEIQKNIRTAVELIASNKEILKELQKTKEKTAEVVEEKNKLDFFLMMAPKIKAAILATKIPMLENLANEKLETIQAPFKLKLAMTKEKSSGIISEFNPLLITDGIETPVYNQSSGGIRRVAFSLLLAALEIGAGRKYGFCSMDEVLDTLDATGRKEIASLITQTPLQGFIITHTPDIEELFKKEILVEMQDGTATAKIIEV